MGLTTDILVFNTASPTESANVGAYLRDSGGNLIPSQTVAATKWLQVAAAMFDGSGNALTSTGGALNVSVSGASLDVGVADKTAFTYGTSIDQPIGGVFQDTSPALTAGQSGVARLTANRAFHMNLRDSSGNELLGQKVMAASVPVVFASDQSALSVSANDAALAATASKASVVSVTTTGAALIASGLANRKYFNVQNNGTISIFVGDSAVTALTGLRVPPGATGEFRCGAANSLFAITATGTNALVNVLELS